MYRSADLMNTVNTLFHRDDLCFAFVIIILDVDECQDNNGGCAQLCNNTVGSFICGCSEGYTLNADDINCSGMHYHSSFSCKSNLNVCTDIDECVLKLDPCHDNATCFNTDGRFNCNCNEGYEGDGLVCTGTLI